MFDWLRRQSLNSKLDGILQLQDLQFAEFDDMALDVAKLRESQARTTALLNDMVTLLAAQNERIGSLTSQLARATGASAEEQTAVDAVAAEMSEQADKIRAALPK